MRLRTYAYSEKDQVSEECDNRSSVSFSSSPIVSIYIVPWRQGFSTKTIDILDQIISFCPEGFPIHFRMFSSLNIPSFYTQGVSCDPPSPTHSVSHQNFSQLRTTALIELISPPSLFFLLPLEAYGVPRTESRSKLHSSCSNAGSFNPLCQARDWIGFTQMPSILFCHSRNSKN